MKALIVSEGGRAFGSGHITRCRALAEGFIQHSVKVAILVHGDKSVTKLIQGMPHRLFTWHDDPAVLNKIVSSYPVVIFDSYHIDQQFYDTLVQTIPLPVFIDDEARLRYHRGIIINGGVHAEQLPYVPAPQATFLLGPAYLPMRKAFWDVAPRSVRVRVRQVMITMGGNDMRSLTPKIMQYLRRYHPSFHQVIVVGSAYSEETKAKIERLADHQTTLVYAPNAVQMKQLMIESDIAISASGQTLYELARTGTPTIAIGVAANQRGNIQGWNQHGFIEWVGWWDDPQLSDRLLSAIGRLIPPSERRRRSEIGQQIVDGQGTRRIIEAIQHKINAS